MRGEEDLGKFHSLYHLNNIQRGSSYYPFGFFREVFNVLYPDDVNMVLTEGKDGRCIGAGIFYIYEPRRAIYFFGVGLDKSLGSRYKIYFNLRWETIKWTEREGYRWISLGCTPSDPREVHYHLKSKLGAEFNQDYIVYVPFNRKLFFLRDMTEKLWRIMRTRLPKQVARRLEDTAEGL